MALRDISRRRSNTSGIGGEANVPEHCSTDAIDRKAPPLGDSCQAFLIAPCPKQGWYAEESLSVHPSLSEIAVA
jgi:hypothetical protein